MAKPISKDKREAIVAHKQAGKTEKEIALWLMVCVSTVSRVWKKYKDSGNCEARPQNSGRKPLVSIEQMQEVSSQISKTPDITLAELITQFSLPISEAALCKRLKKLGYSYKKRHYSQTDKKEKI